jgi:hypothetical protein
MVSVAIFKLVIFYNVAPFSEAEDAIAVMPYKWLQFPLPPVFHCAMDFADFNLMNHISFLRIVTHLVGNRQAYFMYRVIQEESALLWEMIV